MPRVGDFLITLLAVFTILPVLFAPGNVFDLPEDIFIEKDEILGYVEIKGKMYAQLKGSGLYYDNVYNTLLDAFLCSFAMFAPFSFKIDSGWRNLLLRNMSFFISGWYLSGFVIELVNFSVPSEVLNTSSDSRTFFKFVVMFLIMIVATQIYKFWYQKINY